jgi:hypothetical protein
MTAGFEGDVQRRSARSLARRVERVNLGVCFTCSRMVPLPDQDAV